MQRGREERLSILDSEDEEIQFNKFRRNLSEEIDLIGEEVENREDQDIDLPSSPR